MQFFKGDSTEKQYYNSGAPAFDQIGTQKDAFFAGAYTCFPFGDMIYQTGRAPLTNAIKPEIFREAFSEIFASFLVAGTFESYLTVFRKIFGDSVDVEFTVSAPGKLAIDIEADGVEFFDFVARSIVDDAYVFDEIIEESTGDQIVFQTVKGFTIQYELEQMLFEMVPAGIFTAITLTIA